MRAHQQLLYNRTELNTMIDSFHSCMNSSSIKMKQVGKKCTIVVSSGNANRLFKKSSFKRINNVVNQESKHLVKVIFRNVFVRITVRSRPFKVRFSDSENKTFFNKTKRVKFF